MQQPLVAPPPPALSPGTTLANRYLIQGFLGGGGFGHIYLVQDLALGHRRALKEAFCRDAQAQHQFRLEAEFLLNARHPNLVRGYSVFENAGRMYLVMDYVDGQTLEDLAIAHIRETRRPLSETQVLDWMIPICEATHALHSQPMPIIHRDIKPANIKLSASLGIPILIDLGLAKLFAEGTQTLGAALAFTPGYAPPEQYQASGATDRRTDVYGLGATLFYLLTGYQPTEAPARLSAQSLASPRALNPLLTPTTEAAVLHAMALNPDERPQDAHVFAQMLRAARRGLVQSRSTHVLPSISAASQPFHNRTDDHDDGWACSQCGGETPPSGRFCMTCGTPRDTSQPLQRTPSARPVSVGGDVRVLHAQRNPDVRAAVGEGHVRHPFRPVPGQRLSNGISAWAVIPPSPIASMLWYPAPAHAQKGSTELVQERSQALIARPARTLASAAEGNAASLVLFPASELNAPLNQHEIRLALCALLALLAATLSMLGLLSSPLWVVLTLPAVVAAGWSLRHPAASIPREARYLAWTGLALALAVVALRIVMHFTLHA